MREKQKDTGGMGEISKRTCRRRMREEQKDTGWMVEISKRTEEG